MKQHAFELLIEGVAFRELLVQSLKLVKSKLKDSYYDITSNGDGLVKIMIVHLKSVHNWSKYATEIEFISDKITSEVYIDLDYYITPRASHPSDLVDKSHLIESNLIDTVFSKTEKDIAIVGESGMGKTTSMKMIAHKLLFDHEYLPYSFPIVIRLRNVNFPTYSPEEQNFYILKHLQNELGLKFANRKEYKEADLSIENYSKHILSYLDELNALLILDGFDEIPIVHQSNAFKEIDQISLSCKNTRILVTSRTQNFKYQSSTIRQFQIVPLKDPQIKEFACRYLTEAKGLEFFHQLEKSPFKDTSIRPLILSFLLTIFEHSEKLPSRPTDLHSEIIDWLLAKWDKYRSIKRLSRYDDFGIKSKRDFLVDLSYELSKINKAQFSISELNTVYLQIKESFPSLPDDNIDNVLEEIEVQSGVFVKSGRLQYEFPHKSIQEYLTGEYIVNYTPISEILPEISKLPYEAAIATTLSKNSSNFFCIYTEHLLKIRSKEIIKNIDIYLNTLKDLNTVFKANWKLAYQYLKILEELYNMNNVETTPLGHFLNTPGIKGSFVALEKEYKIADPITYVFMNKKGENKHKIIEIKKRTVDARDNTYKSLLRAPALILKDWKYLKSLVK